MAEAPNRVTVHCPSCGDAIDVPVQVSSIQRGFDSLRVNVDPTVARHVCKTQPYIDGARTRADAPGPHPGPAGQLEVTGR